MARAIYSVLWWVAMPLVIAHLLWRARRQPEYLAHWRERWAIGGGRRPAGPLVWVHAVSVGETRAAQPLILALLERDSALRVLLTHTTPTGREAGRALFAQRCGDRVMQCYLPYDDAFAPRRFLRAWRPAAGLLMETEVWPNLCEAARREGIPLALVNARLSEKSLRKGLRWRALLGPAMGALARVVAQSEADAARIARFRDLAGITMDLEVAGNLKFDVSPDEALVARGRGWRDALQGRAVVLAASTRDGEEDLLLDAWQSVLRDVATPPSGARAEAPLLVLVPRHPQRFATVAAGLERRGLRFARRSDGDELFSGPGLEQTAVLLGDSMGEMFAWYAMADVAIIGGTLLPLGGQNLIEACAVGTPVILGPSTFNFEDAATQAIAAGAAVRVADAPAAVQAALRGLRDPDAAARAAHQAADFAARHRGATRRTLDAVAPLLPPVPSGG